MDQEIGVKVWKVVDSEQGGCSRLVGRRFELQWGFLLDVQLQAYPGRHGWVEEVVNLTLCLPGSKVLELTLQRAAWKEWMTALLGKEEAGRRLVCVKKT